MLIGMYVMEQTGEVNGIFDVVPATDFRVDGAFEADIALIKERLRYDREANKTPGPGPCPSQDPSVVKFFYLPSMERQRLYAQGFPIDVGSYKILDAFVCMGSRFGLRHLQVYVELCLGCDGYLWANVYFVADSQVPAVIIRIHKVTLEYETKAIQEAISRDEESFERSMKLLGALEKE